MFPLFGDPWKFWRFDLYKLEKISIRELFEQKLTDEKSIKALRSRVKENILVYVDMDDDGRTRLYDKHLSSIRAKSARRLKKSNPQVNWSVFKRVFERLDKKNPGLNENTIASLNNGSTKEDAIKFAMEMVTDRLLRDGHENFINPAAK
jgi:single-stranded DNA-specific DHH superfamily exonuclease